jgi:hypothetical protein
MTTILPLDAGLLHRPCAGCHDCPTAAVVVTQGVTLDVLNGRSLAGNKALARGAPLAGNRAHAVAPALPAIALGYGVQPHGSEAKRREGYPTGPALPLVVRQRRRWPCGLVALLGATSRIVSQRAKDAASRHGKQGFPEIHRNLVTKFVHKTASGVHNSPFFSLGLKEFPMKSTTCKSIHRIKYNYQLPLGLCARMNDAMISTESFLCAVRAKSIAESPRSFFNDGSAPASSSN